MAGEDVADRGANQVARNLLGAAKLALAEAFRNVATAGGEGWHGYVDTLTNLGVKGMITWTLDAGAAGAAYKRAIDKGIPVELETILTKATAKEASDRYASAGALAPKPVRWNPTQPTTW